MGRSKKSRQRRANLPANPRQAGTITYAEQTTLSTFTGPIPPPEVLMQYDHVEPGLAREIFDMARQQSTHRQTLERTVVSRQSRNETLGILCGTAVAVAALYASVELIRAGFPGAGLVGVLAEVIALAGVFIARTRSTGKELASKR